MALRAAPELRRVSLRFIDKAAERRFQGQYFRDNLPYIRAAHVVGVAAWAFFGLYAGQGASMRYELHVVLGYGVAIPLLAASLALTYTRWYARIWQQLGLRQHALSSGLHRGGGQTLLAWPALLALITAEAELTARCRR